VLSGVRPNLIVRCEQWSYVCWPLPRFRIFHSLFQCGTLCYPNFFPVFRRPPVALVSPFYLTPGNNTLMGHLSTRYRSFVRGFTGSPFFGLPFAFRGPAAPLSGCLEVVALFALSPSLFIRNICPPTLDRFRSLIFPPEGSNVHVGVSFTKFSL